MKKIVRLTESQLKDVVKKIIAEQQSPVKVGMSVSIINQERRPGYMPVNDPKEVITFDGKVCSVDGEWLVVKNDKNLCVMLPNDPKSFYNSSSNRVNIVYTNLSKSTIRPCGPQHGFGCAPSKGKPSPLV